VTGAAELLDLLADQASEHKSKALLVEQRKQVISGCQK
jgi:hypothetical protein